MRQIISLPPAEAGFSVSKIQGQGPATSQLRSIRVVRSASERPSLTRLHVSDDIVLTARIAQDVGSIDSELTYDVRIDPAALSDMSKAIRLADGVTDESGSQVETGGYLLGQFDDACGVVWVTQITGPPPGSAATSSGFILNPEAAPFFTERVVGTRGMCRRIGSWHTHPNGPIRPSDIDQTTMRELASRQQLILVTSGEADLAEQHPTDNIHAEIFRTSV